ncbi:terminase small subunit [Novosphingobium sp. NDB2Meth1]|uniref:terminase small subunit n=1 Tax=Novosphingobium sp. NDB2Meth1 TaxID=1892847 RepID=UPI000930FB8B|nr:terminase small subunit [Novosphingobium sp. NDB2Meth1]
MALTPKQQAFVNEYLIDLCGAKAATRAGYSAKSARRIAVELLEKPDVQAAIKLAMEQRSERTEITADMVLQHWFDLATADPNELVQYRRHACRYCHGDGHAYQWRDIGEFEEAKTKATQNKRAAPTDEGGYGYTTHAAPDPRCPRCDGDGVEKPFFADTRRLSAKGKALYAGIKQGRDGLEVLMHDPQKAWDNVARHLGMFKDRLELTGKDGGPVEINSTGGVSGLLAAARQAVGDADRSST